MNIYKDNFPGNNETEKVSLVLTTNDLMVLKEVADKYSGNLSQAARMMIKKGYYQMKEEESKQQNLFTP